MRRVTYGGAPFEGILDRLDPAGGAVGRSMGADVLGQERCLDEYAASSGSASQPGACPGRGP